MKEIKSFKDAQDYLASIPCIHFGGCGISAYVMYKWLKQNKRVPRKFSFMFLYTDHYEYIHNKGVLEGEDDEPKACSHIAIKYRKRIIDAEGVINENYTHTQAISDPNFLLRTINNVGSWNHCFNRDYVPKIAKTLHLDLSEIRIRDERYGNVNDLLKLKICAFKLKVKQKFNFKPKLNENNSFYTRQRLSYNWFFQLFSCKHV